MAKKKRASKIERKAKNVSPIPKGFHALTPYLAVRGAAQAIDWYKRAFGAKEATRQLGPGGMVLNAELTIGDSRFMISDILPGSGAKSPLDLGGSPVTLHVYTKDVDAFWARAVGAGAKVEMELANQFWGDRYGQLVDPFGHAWSLASRKENLTPKQHAERAAGWMAQIEKSGGMM